MTALIFLLMAIAMMTASAGYRGTAIGLFGVSFVAAVLRVRPLRDRDAAAAALRECKVGPLFAWVMPPARPASRWSCWWPSACSSA